MYGTHVYLRSRSWLDEHFVEMKNVRRLDIDDSAVSIECLGDQPWRLAIGQTLQIGVLAPDGRRFLYSGGLWSIDYLLGIQDHSAIRFNFWLDASIVVFPMHPDEAERRANIAAKADAERLAKLETEEPDDRHEKRDRLFQMIMQDMKEIRDLIEGRIDAAERAAL